MPFRKALLTAAIVAGLAIPTAEAATFKLELDEGADGSIDYTGSFVAPVADINVPDQVVLTSISLPSINGVVFNTIAASPLSVPATFVWALPILELFGSVLDHAIAAGQATEVLNFDTAGNWQISTCEASGFCVASGSRGQYLVSPAAPVPIPAALPLLASGLGALGFMGWRRNRKAASVAAR